MRTSDIIFIVPEVDTIEAIRSDPTIEALTPVATQTLQLVQSQIDNLDSATQILTTALDELTKIHPFVSGSAAIDMYYLKSNQVFL